MGRGFVMGMGLGRWGVWGGEMGEGGEFGVEGFGNFLWNLSLGNLWWRF
jgi:hypothetical protein